jgi:phage terminase small subunit
MTQLRDLTEAQHLFVQCATAGLTTAAAARAAGISEEEGQRIVQLPHIQAAMAEIRNKLATKLEITREDVARGFLDAVRSSANSMELVAAWREIGKLLGHYAAERVENTINVAGVAKLTQMKQLDDKELLDLIGVDPTKVLQGSCERVEEAYATDKP